MTAHRHIIEVADGFWNIRGSYRVAGLLDVGTQASLVRLESGYFVLLDAYTFSPSVARFVGDLTQGGNRIEAVLNLHPFHTLHVEAIHERYPDATLYGTARHKAKFPSLPWAELSCEDPALHLRYAADFEFSIPRGVDFISADEHVHFSSVLAYHRASRTIHSDDTIMYMNLAGPMRWFGLGDAVSYHPTLAKALEQRPGAAQDFRDWAGEMTAAWRDADNLCAAHTGTLLGRDNDGDSIHDRLQAALDKVEPKLVAHEKAHG